MSSSTIRDWVRRGGFALVVSMLCLAGHVHAQGGGRKGGVLVSVPPVPTQPALPPFDLTASDGSGLQLVSLQVRGVVQDPLAFTELHLRFHNPENRVREGRFRITLPTGATISRFAMKINGNWMEGEVVERQAARRAYEDFLHRRQDPALLENEAGNEFSARVFPIPAGADKELIVSYSQELPRVESPYHLPLVGLPTLSQLDIRVMVARTGTSGTSGKSASSLGGSLVRHEVIEVKRSNFRPDQDLVIDRDGRSAQKHVALRHDNLVVARVTPLAGKPLPAQGFRSLLVLLDTSASRALGFAAQVQRFSSVVETLRKGGDFELQVVAFDQAALPFYLGKASGWGSDDEQRLLDRRAEGASDLVGALRFATQRYQGKASFDRILIVGDGMSTAGATGGDEVRAAVKDLTSIGIQRADVLAVGGIRDESTLGALVRGNLASDGMAMAPDMDPGAVASRLRLATRSGLKVVVPGAKWVWPQTIDGIQPGDEVLIYADLPDNRPLTVTVGGVTVADRANVQLTQVEQPLLERAWVNARLLRLAEQRDTSAAGDADLREALVKQMIELSTRHRVLCDYTALLVLETEADYQRFGIARRSLADILAVGPTGIEVMNRKNAAPVVIAEEAPAKSSVAPEPPGDGARPVPANVRTDAEEAEKDEAPARELAARDNNAPAAAPAPSARPDRLEDFGAAASVAGGQGRGQAGRPNGALDDRARSSEGMARRAGPAASRPGRPRNEVARQEPEQKKQRGPEALTGEFATIMKQIQSGQKKAALARALAWRQGEPGNVLAIVALGEALLALGNKDEAARVFGSIIDLFPSRADLRRYAAGHLERLGNAGARALAVDCLQKTVEQRADHPSSHHLLAMALLKVGEPRAAFEAVEVGLQQSYPDGRFAGAQRILQEDLGLAAAAWAARAPAEKNEIQRRLVAAGGQAETARSVRFVLTWETDANDVDFHINDARGGHAFYSSPHLPSGGDLYADVTTGYGPECFTVRGPANAGPYHLSAHYYSRGPMGYGMGRLEAIEHDGHGHLQFQTRPFVVMNDGAFVELGTYNPGKGPQTSVLHPKSSGGVRSPVRQ